MERPIRIAFHGMTPSDDVARRVEEKARRLERYFDRIVGCQVTVELPGRRHRHGKHVRVRVELKVPGRTLVVGRDPDENVEHEDLDAALNAAFREARRQLEDHARRRDHRAAPRARVAPARGRVTRVFPEQGYGFLETEDGREIYFDARSVLRGGFARMSVGSQVRFAEEPGDEGPQASTVTLGRASRRVPA